MGDVTFMGDSARRLMSDVMPVVIDVSGVMVVAGSISMG